MHAHLSDSKPNIAIPDTQSNYQEIPSNLVVDFIYVLDAVLNGLRAT